MPATQKWLFFIEIHKIFGREISLKKKIFDPHQKLQGSILGRDPSSIQVW